MIETESEGWDHGEKMVKDVGLYGLEFVPNFVFQEKVHFDGQSRLSEFALCDDQVEVLCHYGVCPQIPQNVDSI